jgi:hypothetical protein
MDNQEEEDIKKIWRQIKAMESTEYMKVIRRKNNCGTWKLTGGNSQTKQRNAKLKGLLSNYILKMI